MQCKHVILGCGHDAGYAPFLEHFAGDRVVRERITLLEGSKVQPKIRALGFEHTIRFETVFDVLKVLEGSTSISPSRSSASIMGPSPPFLHYSVQVQELSERLGPVLRDSKGKRIDKELKVDSSLVNIMRARNLCAWFYLRGECKGCPRIHSVDILEGRNYDALWMVSRRGACNKIRKGKDCDDDRCIYGHS